MFEEKSILTPRDVMAYLGIGRSKCYELFRSKNFPVLTLGKLKRVLKSELDAYLQAMTEGLNYGKI